MSSLKKLLIVALIFSAGFLFGQKSELPKQQAATAYAGAETRPASMMFTFDLEKVEAKKIEWKENLTIFDATKSVAGENGWNFEFKDYGDLGILIEKIDDKKNGEENRYWQFWVNNEQVQTSANAAHLMPGDVVNWQFRKSEF